MPGAPTQIPGARTQMPGAAAVPPSGNATQQHYAPGQAFAAAAPALPGPNKRPVFLLAAIIALLLVIVAGAGIAIAKRGKFSVLGSQGFGLPKTPGVQVGQTPNMPGGPGVITGQNPVPGAGQPVTGQQPHADGVAPSVLMAPGSRVPGAPSVISTPSQPQVPGAPVISTPSQPQAPAPPVAAGPSDFKVKAPPPIPTRDGVETYLAWLRWVESERSQLEIEAGNRQAHAMPDMIASMFADPDSLERMPQQMQAEFTYQANRQALFWRTMFRTKPVVPGDCVYLDRYYMTAAQLEMSTTTALARAMAQKNMGAVEDAQRSVRLIHTNLQRADAELNKIRDVRRLPQDWNIKYDGGGGSMPGLPF